MQIRHSSAANLWEGAHRWPMQAQSSAAAQQAPAAGVCHRQAQACTPVEHSHDTLI